MTRQMIGMYVNVEIIYCPAIPNNPRCNT